ncbi:hypothetical protein P8452_33612 [Trifolium repens]|nr:hypothetical protein P8452_33612 [Trifolium repens]
MQESQPEYYTDQIIKGLALTMLLAGTDSSAVTLEWSMSNILNHPEVEEGKLTSHFHCFSTLSFISFKPLLYQELKVM